MELEGLDNHFFETIVHQCSDFVVITDSQSHVLYVNPAFEQHTGYELNHIKGKNISIVKSGLHNLQFYKQLWVDLLKGNSVSKVFINKKITGELYYEHKTISPIRASDGTISHFLSTSKDVSREILLQKKNMGQKDFIHKVLQNTDSLIIGIDQEKKIILFNKTCEKVTGYSSQEVMGKCLLDKLIPEAIRDEARQFFDNIFESQKKVEKFEIKWYTKLNEEIIVRWSNSLIHDGESGKNMLLATGIDITKERENEHKLILLNSKLEEKVKERTEKVELLHREIVSNNKLLNKIKSNIPAIVYLLNTETKRIKILNNTIRYKLTFPLKQDSEVSYKDFVKYFSTGNGIKPDIKEFSNINADNDFDLVLNNEKLHVQNRVVIFDADENGNPISYLGIITDITSIKKTKNRLEQSQKIAHIGTWEWDMITNELYWSDETYRIFGKKTKKFVPTYSDFLEIVHSEDREMVEKEIRKAIDKKAEYNVTHRLEPYHGILKYVDERGRCEYDENGKPVKMIGTVRDITEFEFVRSRMEETQRLAKMGTWEWNKITNEVYWSKQMFEIFGVDPEKNELNRDSARSYIHPDDREKVDSTLADSAKTGESYALEYRIISGDNKIKYLCGRGYTEFSQEGIATRVLGTTQDITEERVLKNKLEASHITLENSLSAIFANEMNGKITYANKAAVKMWGYNNLSEMLHEKPMAYNYWHIIEKEKVTNCIAEVIKTGHYVTEEPYMAVTKSGEIRLIKFKISLIKDIHNEPVGMTSSFFDVTDEIKIKREIGEYEKKVNLLFSNIDEIVYGVDIYRKEYNSGNIFFLSGRTENIIGYNFADLKKSPEMWLKSVHPSDVEQVKKTTELAIKERRGVTRIYRMKHKLKNEFVWLEDKIMPEFNEKGEIKHLYGSARDVTERIRSEKLLAESERKYRSIYENVLAGIFRINYFDRRPIDVNDACVKLFGYNSKEDFIINFNFGESYEKNDVSEFRFKELFNHKEIQNQRFSFKRKDGTFFWGNTSIKILWEEGIIEAVIVDVTQRKIYEEQLKKSVVEKDILLKEVHHRVKNNLQIISSLLRLQLNKISDPIIKEPLEQSHERIKAIALIHEKLYLSEDVSTINFSDYLVSVSKSFIALHPEKNVKVIYTVKDYFTEIGKALPLGLICYEALSNAFKHAFKHDGEHVLEIIVNAGADNKEIIIVDNGNGFEVESMQNENTLGWKLINNLAKQAKTKLDIVSVKGKGTSVLIKL